MSLRRAVEPLVVAFPLVLVACGGRGGAAGGNGGGAASDGPSQDGSDAAPSRADSGASSEGADAGANAGQPSCVPGGDGLTNCGDGRESCCTSLLVPGGTYDRTFDPLGPDGGIEVGDDGGPVGLADPAILSSFRLDKYEVTVGRWRQFSRAFDGGAGVLDGGAGYVPAVGSGKHSHLNDGLGLENGAQPGTYETGWTAGDTGYLPPLGPDFSCENTDTSTFSWPDATTTTWTATPGPNEKLPMNCVSWYEAYAFCIWDGGFLPSEAEWEYAAAGGDEQREYPWGSAPPGTNNQYAIYGTGAGTCYYPAQGPCDFFPAPVGTATLGVGRWGQVDLAGNVSEWVLDVGANTDRLSINVLNPANSFYPDPCSDCAYLGAGYVNVDRGGSFYDGASTLGASERAGINPWQRSVELGFRCARSP